MGSVSGPKWTNCHMNSDLQPTNRRRWYVFEGDWGGQIFLTIPVEMVPKWVNRRRMRRLLRFLNGVAWSCCERPEEGCEIQIYEDLGNPEPDGFYQLPHDEIEAYLAEELRLHEEELTQGARPAHMYKTPFVPRTHLPGWKAVGGVLGGMGGGGLLDGELWIHYEFLFRGLDYVNEIRRLLGLKRLEPTDVVMDEDQFQHAEMFVSELG